MVPSGSGAVVPEVSGFWRVFCLFLPFQMVLEVPALALGWFG